ncbi:MAG: hypothetical protein ACW97P_08850 [Candidatus Hodarchaeales archaeon]|jgi:hypothetical protein
MGFRIKLGRDEKITYSSSTRTELISELQRSELNLVKSPFPFCDDNCPWWSRCIEINTSECVHLFLQEILQKNHERKQEHDYIEMTWE